MTTIAAIAEELSKETELAGELHLRIEGGQPGSGQPEDRLLGEWHVVVRVSSPELLEILEEYFQPFVDARPAPAQACVVTALSSEAVDPARFGLEFRDWPREAGKTGRKEAIVDLADGRIVQKVRTGMLFLLGTAAGTNTRVAVGPCDENANQIINFINALWMEARLHQGDALCHAAGVVHPEGGGLVLAAASGGGKSTLALHLLSAGFDYCTNDRLLAARGPRGVEMRGVPKLPRVNPGTLLGNKNLHGLLTPERLAELQALPTEALWPLEEKHDVDIATCFPDCRWQLVAPLGALVVLDWELGSSSPTTLKPFDLAERPDLLGAIVKSPGPFYSEPDGRALPAQKAADPALVLEQLRGVPTYELVGGVDFDAAVETCRTLPALSRPASATGTGLTRTGSTQARAGTAE